MIEQVPIAVVNGIVLVFMLFLTYKIYVVRARVSNR